MELCSRQYYLILEHFITSERNPIPTNNHSSFPSRPHTHPPATTNMPLCIYLFWTFHINGIIQYVVFHSWLFPLSIIYLKFSHVGVCIDTSLVFLPHSILLYRHTTFCLFIQQLTDIWVASLMANDIRQFFMYSLAICEISLKKWVFRTIFCFFIWLFL